MPSGVDVSVLSPITEHTTPDEPSVRPITLVDTVEATRDNGEGHSLDLSSSAPSSAPDFTLERRWTKQSLQRQLTARKYARYQEHRLVDRSIEDDDTITLVTGSSTPTPRPASVGRLTRLFARRKIRQSREEDIVIDVLYENQRGAFTFGIPHFSANSLLNFDPKPWTNAHRRTSPVNITNAQLPDPTWEWVWDSWYVDMSRDVDEQGWEYSLWFQNTAAWHGNHPWFHSFVRRRRWLRKRVRRTASQTAPRTMEASVAAELAVSENGHTQPCDAYDLIKTLRACSIDREKLAAFKRHISADDSDLRALQNEMAHIMDMLVFQETRRDLLDALVDRQLENERRDEPATKEGVELWSLRCEYLKRAVHVAKHQVECLEYWSDVKRTTLQTPDNAECAEVRGGDRDWVVLPGDHEDSLYKK